MSKAGEEENRISLQKCELKSIFDSFLTYVTLNL